MCVLRQRWKEQNVARLKEFVDYALFNPRACEVVEVHHESLTAREVVPRDLFETIAVRREPRYIC